MQSQSQRTCAFTGWSLFPFFELKGHQIHFACFGNSSTTSCNELSWLTCVSPTYITFSSSTAETTEKRLPAAQMDNLTFHPRSGGFSKPSLQYEIVPCAKYRRPAPGPCSYTVTASMIFRKPHQRSFSEMNVGNRVTFEGKVMWFSGLCHRLVKFFLPSSEGLALILALSTWVSGIKGT